MAGRSVKSNVLETDYATPTESTGTTALMTRPLPDMSVMSRRDPEFEPVEIAKKEFEEVWTTRKFKKTT
jgi:hypothetical protein